MWETIELQEIRAFLTVAEELHFGQAAERLYLTPSRVSQLIRSLEGQVGGRLFDRTSRRVTLTALGGHLYKRLEPAYRELRAALADAHNAATGITGTVRVGVVLQSSGGPYLLDLVRVFEALYPRCRVVLADITYHQSPYEQLRRGELDLLAIRLPIPADDNLTVGPILATEDRILVVAKDHPLAGRDSVTFNDVADYETIDVPNAPRELMNHLIPPRAEDRRPIRRVVSVNSAAEAMAQAALGGIVYPTVSSVKQYYHHPDVVFIPIAGAPPSQTALVWRVGGLSIAAQTFADVAAEELPKLSGSHIPLGPN